MSSEPKYGDGCNGGDSTLKPIHFFRIMHAETLSQGKLRIPGKFVRKYGKCLSNTMFLKLPNGAEWKVSVEKIDGGVWFHKGWKEFMEYYSLAHGHLLVFRYDGTSHFHVLICGLSTMEIDYPFNKLDQKRTYNSELQLCKRLRTSGNTKDESNSNLQDCKGIVLELQSMLKNPNEEKKNSDQHTERSSISNCGEAADSTSFMVIIKSHHLKWSLKLPNGTLKGYIKPGRHNNVMLMVGDKSWRVNFIHKPNHSPTISAGWLRFARENNLEVGDACLFELLNSSDEMVMKVFIYKGSSVKS